MELLFSLPIMGTIKLNGENVTVSINRSEINLELPADFIESLVRQKQTRPDMNLADIVLEAALTVSNQDNCAEFTASELFRVASQKHPNINKRSFWSRVIASAPSHPSFVHFKSQRHYLRYIGRGVYMLEPREVITSDPHYNPGYFESLWGSKVYEE
ncbi:MAG: hypothetical protein TUN42_01785 [Dehalogenimonas sp.]